MLVKNSIVRIKSGRFVGIEGKIVERKGKNAQFASIYADRMRNFVHVGITIELRSQNGEPVESYFYVTMQTSNLEILATKRSKVYNGAKGDSDSRSKHKKFLAELEMFL